MRTVFLCPELALQIEGYDTHTYQVAEHVHVRYRERLVALAIESISFNADVREITLRRVRASEAAAAGHGTRIPDVAEVEEPDWVESMCKDIEGKKGPVSWQRHPSSR